jgi:peptidyl-prolyl cis-trans isomerase SurA
MKTRLVQIAGCLSVLAALCLSMCHAQNRVQTQPPVQAGGALKGSAASQGTVESNTQPVADGAVPVSAGVLVDQVVAVVNGDLVLESDVQEEKHFAAFQPLTPKAYDRDETVERLIDRDLILQQARLQPDDMVSRTDAIAQLQVLRKDIPACKQYHCETDAGWDKFVHDQGLTMDELISHWQQRMEILKFIEIRFRSGILITPAEIKDYYDETLLPAYAARHSPAPKLEVISDRIQEILLQQQVGSLLGDWLKSLKAQGTVRVMRPGGVQP